MKVKAILLVCLSMLMVSSVHASGSLEETVNEIYDLSGPKNNLNIGVTLRYDNKTTPELVVKGTYVPIRSLFEHTADQISWDHNSKVAFIETDGKQLVVTKNKKFVASKDQVVLPSEWVRLLKGRILINFPYLAYIFDRYAKHNDGSDAALWKERLIFLGISYIDTH